MYRDQTRLTLLKFNKLPNSNVENLQCEELLLSLRGSEFQCGELFFSIFNLQAKPTIVFCVRIGFESRKMLDYPCSPIFSIQ